MSSIRERLEAKARRRVIAPVQVSDPSGDQATWAGALAALNSVSDRERRGDAQPGEVDAATRLLEEAAAAVRDHYAEVELQALPAADWEAAVSGWTTDNGVDWAAALAPLLAASCVDADLRDEDWWRDRLADPAWSEGDRDTLRSALLRLNVAAVDPIVPKG